MAESEAHILSVRNIATYISSDVPGCEVSLIQADLAEYGSRTPQVINGYYPDVYYRTPSLFIIGEAKTDNDIENVHTDSQISSYIKELKATTRADKHLVLATSFYSFAMWCNKIAKMKTERCLDDITIHIIDNLARSHVL